jgi:hypothetical protein
MAEYKTKNFESSLKKKGFKIENRDHKYFFYYSKGKKQSHIFTFTSHSEKDFDDFLFKRRQKQIKIEEKSDMLNFYNCPMTKKMYEEYLISEGHIEPEGDE